MVTPRIVERPAFRVAGRKAWISGPDNAIFGRFWVQCRAEGLFETFARLTGMRPGAQTGGTVLGVSRVEQDPAKRDFYYMIAVETEAEAEGLESYLVPAARWAVFSSRGLMPEALVQAEMHAFMEWLPASGYRHALAPEMEVYPPEEAGPGGEVSCEFWLPITEEGTPI